MDHKHANNDQTSKSGLLRRLFERITNSVQRKSLEEAMTELVEAYDDEKSALGKEEQLMLQNVLHFSKMTADDILTPRDDIVAVPDNISLEELVKIAVEQGHSRMPVYHDTIDHIKGFVHVKDVLPLLAKKPAGNFKLSSILRQVLLIPPSLRLINLIAKMRSARVHMAVVIDEYGGTEGLLTIEDVVEKIIGHIEDEHDDNAVPNIVMHASNILESAGRTPIEEIEQALGVELADAETKEDCHTIGGLLSALSNRVPVAKETIEHPAGYLFTILEADPRRVKRIKIEPVPK